MEWALAVDIGGTKVESVLVTSGGRLDPVTRFRAPTGCLKSETELAETVGSVIRRTLAARASGAVVIGAGIGAAGPIDREAGTISPVNLPAWRSFELRGLVENVCASEGLTIPVILRHDGLCFTLAEHWVGAAKGYQNVLGIVVSTGIGGGLIISGRPAPGHSGNAGHLGQIEVTGFDTADSDSTLEEIASGPNTVLWARQHGFAGNTGEELADAHARGDAVAIAAVERSGLAIGRALASASTLIDLELVVIGGGFTKVSPDLLDHVRRGIDRFAKLDFAKRMTVSPSSLGDNGPLLGAAALVHQHRRLSDEQAQRSRVLSR